MAYQMMDGSASTDQVRITCKMSPNAVVALRPVWIQDSHMSLIVIQALDGPIRFD
jgi:hypothetical protein